MDRQRGAELELTAFPLAFQQRRKLDRDAATGRYSVRIGLLL